jgi:hypothetical protein
MTVQVTYADVIQKTEQMVQDRAICKLAAKHGLGIVNVTWEDTGRYKGSAVGPNISDITIQVQDRLPDSDQYRLTCMPVIRYPNFSDITGDISPDLFFVLVGNEKGEDLRKITLRELLGNLRGYLHAPSSWKGNRKALLAEGRDTHVLVSAQACFLPVPQEGIAKFNPVLFNYQSSQGNPAVLTILATREGTSVTVIDNTRDGFEAGRTWGQRLFFNLNGERCSLTGKRKSDFVAEAQQEGSGSDGPSALADREGLNMVLLIQVPLKHKEPEYPGGDVLFCCMAAPCGLAEESDVEEAVIGHGKVEGPFTEIDGLEIERDDRFPVRVTVQFYKATSNGVVSDKDLAEIGAQIDRVYKEADYVGSLVVQGETGRPTEHTGPKFEPPGWWDDFWKRHYANTGQTQEEAVKMLHDLLGHDWSDRTVGEVEQAMQEKQRTTAN